MQTRSQIKESREEYDLLVNENPGSKNEDTATISKTIVALLVVWALGWPDVANEILSSLN